MGKGRIPTWFMLMLAAVGLLLWRFRRFGFL